MAIRIRHFRTWKVGDIPLGYKEWNAQHVMDPGTIEEILTDHNKATHDFLGIYPGPHSHTQAQVDGLVTDLARKVELVNGLVPVGLLGSGTPLSSTFLTGNGTWEEPGGGGSASHVHVYNEAPGKVSINVYEAAYQFVEGTLQVWVNGLKERNFVESMSGLERRRLTFIREPDNIYDDDSIEISYIKA